MRRRSLLALALCTRPLQAAPGRLAAAWGLAGRWQLGWLREDGPALVVEAALDLPTRAHGLALDARGRLLAVARRPGDWMLRWDGRRAPQWHWAPDDWRFNGHVVAGGQALWATGSDPEGGAGLLGRFDPETLARQAAWPTGGHDPHQLLDPGDGTLWVANGGLETRLETGRAKWGRDRMDASLVRLAADGRMLGRWRLDDPRLSIRHLARGGPGLAVALQAEHEAAEARDAAPVLALFDGQALRPVPAPRPLGGYGGDVAWSAGTVRVSCPRARGPGSSGGVAAWDAAGRWQGWQPLPEANALAGPWAGGHPAAARDGKPVALPGLRLDNHLLVA